MCIYDMIVVKCRTNNLTLYSEMVYPQMTIFWTNKNKISEKVLLFIYFIV